MPPAPPRPPAGNIWTHLLPALLLVVLVLGGQLQAWQGARLAFAANVGSIAACFLGSVLYHTCMANHHQHDHWLKLDVSAELAPAPAGAAASGTCRGSRGGAGPVLRVRAVCRLPACLPAC